MKTIVVHSQQRWEYVAVNRRSEATLAEELNTFGAKGWELVTVVNYKDMKGIPAWTAFLKRPSGGQPIHEEYAAADSANAGLSNVLSGGLGSTISHSPSGISSDTGVGHPAREVRIDTSADADSLHDASQSSSK